MSNNGNKTISGQKGSRMQRDNSRMLKEIHMRRQSMTSLYRSEGSFNKIRTRKGGDDAINCFRKYLCCCACWKYKEQPITQIEQAYVPKLKPKAVTVYDNDGQETDFDRAEYKQVVTPRMPDSGRRMTKQETYGHESNEGSVGGYQAWLGRMLDFKMDDDVGVSNTFTVPYFNYNLLMRNKYHSKSEIRSRRGEQ